VNQQQRDAANAFVDECQRNAFCDNGSFDRKRVGRRRLRLG
jgi:hypothetical protein